MSLQLWSDFECEPCRAASSTIDELEREYRGRLRVVWRHLATDEHARVRAEAAQEAFAQKGDAAFWAFHDRLFDTEGAERATVVATSLVHQRMVEESADDKSGRCRRST